MIQSIISRRCVNAISQRRIRKVQHNLSTKSKSSSSFFQRVNSQMKSESPHQYEQYDKGRLQALDNIKRKIEEERAANSGKWWVSSDLKRPVVPEQVLSDDALDNNQSSIIKPFTSPNQDKMMPKSPSVFSTINANIAALESSDTSISSLFAPIPPSSSKVPLQKHNTTMGYNPDYFETYYEIMNVVLQDEKMEKYIKKAVKEGIKMEAVELVKEWLLSDERVVEKSIVQDRWKKLDQVWREGWKEGASIFQETTNHTGTGDSGYESSKILTELNTQQELFVSNFLASNPTLLEVFLKDCLDDEETAKNEITKQFNTISTQLITFLLRHCAKRSRSDPMHVCWYKVKELGLKLPQDSIATCLYVVTTMGSSTLGSMFRSTSSSYKDEEEDNAFLVPEEVATYHDLLCKPTENSVSIRIKTLAGKGDTETAEELLEAYKASIQDTNSEELIRLRTYIPIFKNYCDAGNVAKALSVFHRMKTTSGVILEPENYCMLIATLAENGCFSNDASPIEGATDLGYENSSGPGLLDEIANDMADNVLEISSASARRLSNALASGFKDSPKADSENMHSVVSKLKEAHPLAPMQASKEAAAINELVACRVLLDRSTGVCEVTGAQQQLILLEPEQRKQLHNDLIDLAGNQYTNYMKDIDLVRDKHAASDSANKATEQLQKFSDWLNTREGEPYTAIVDGANVGYYMQNFTNGRFNYHQIKFMVDTLEARGEKPLVILPNKYNRSSYVITSKHTKQQLDQSDVDIMRYLIDRDMLYSVPPRCLDDLYWMVASISDQTVSRRDRDMSVASDSSGRFPGTRPILITNDQMRDHKLELLEPRLFRRWYGCHIVNYNFTAFVMDESVAGNEIRFAQADFFSREVQGNIRPTAEAGKWTGVAWHFPVSDWDLDERFVICIPRAKPESL